MKAAALAVQANPSTTGTRALRINTPATDPVPHTEHTYQNQNVIRIDDDDREASPPVVEIKLSPRRDEDAINAALRQAWEIPLPTTRKRSCDELDGGADVYQAEEEEDDDDDSDDYDARPPVCVRPVSADARKELIIRIAPRQRLASTSSSSITTTPSKRQRISDPARTDMLNRKRSSEELDLDPRDDEGKRRKAHHHRQPKSSEVVMDSEDEQNEFFAS